jgi:hypothetical protein
MPSHRDRSTLKWCARPRKRSRSVPIICRSAALAGPKRSPASRCSWPHPSRATSLKQPWRSTWDRSRPVPTWSKSIVAARPAKYKKVRTEPSSWDANAAPAQGQPPERPRPKERTRCLKVIDRGRRYQIESQSMRITPRTRLHRAHRLMGHVGHVPARRRASRAPEPLPRLPQPDS